jgi:hypothetical protein
MPKLTDTQSILLSHAAQRRDLSLYPLPDSHVRSGARITKAIAQLVDAAYLEERDTSAAEQVSRTDGDLRFGMFVTAEGLAAIGIEPDSGAGMPHSDEQLVKATAPSSQPRPTKAAMVIALLEQEQGATLAELIAATGWLPHTTRAALTGLRKKGHAIGKSSRDGATCYRIGASA